MADNKSIATRDSYGAALLELADAGHDDIVVFDADLSASTRTSVFAKKYSERFFDCGIAECNMVGVAAGMSTFGYVPLFPRLPCLLRAALLSRSATASVTPS